MSYPSIDILQKFMSEQFFTHTKDSKKAAGRALGTFIEIISYYLLRSWDLTDAISIEKGLAEYGNPSITHNVEFTLHPIICTTEQYLTEKEPITSSKILKNIPLDDSFTKKYNTLLDNGHTLKNACIIAENTIYSILSSITNIEEAKYGIKIYTQHKHPYAMFECKRVGVEEGNKKGPQTIEKAKQGAYVAQNTSALQKIHSDTGEQLGIIYDNGKPIIRPYWELLHYLVNNHNGQLLKNFTLSVGIVSNHGNWFTSDNPNKELKVLAQSYDWLLFLSDDGLAQFITDLIFSPSLEYQAVRKAFCNSYYEGKKKNIFTKVRMDFEAHKALCKYFQCNLNQIEQWFNIITPVNETIQTLKNELFTLKNKNWEKIL